MLSMTLLDLVEFTKHVDGIDLKNYMSNYIAQNSIIYDILKGTNCMVGVVNFEDNTITYAISADIVESNNIVFPQTYYMYGANYIIELNNFQESYFVTIKKVNGE